MLAPHNLYDETFQSKVKALPMIKRRQINPAPYAISFYKNYFFIYLRKRVVDTLSLVGKVVGCRQLTNLTEEKRLSGIWGGAGYVRNTEVSVMLN